MYYRRVYWMFYGVFRIKLNDDYTISLKCQGKYYTAIWLFAKIELLMPFGLK